MLRRRVLPVLLVAGCLALSACTSAVGGHGSRGPSATRTASSAARSGTPPSASPTPLGQPRATFVDCSKAFRLDVLSFPAGRRARLSYGCATIAVPLDYAKPSGPAIRLQLLKVHDTANRAGTGDLLINPGGPGDSGVNFTAGFSAQVPDAVLSHFDLIGFDPRGVGLSSPVQCLTTKQKDALNAASPNILTAAGFQQAKRSARFVARACSSRYGSALAQFDTVQTARDMDRIRQAVGDRRMNYLGFSYGTELGSVYAHLFPKTVRVAVLDGAVDPLTDPITSFAGQLQGFESAFDQFAAWCRTHSPCTSLGDPRGAVARVIAAATRTAIPSSARGELRVATSSIVVTAVLAALYSRSSWPALGQALIKAGAGDSAGLLLLADQYNQRYNGQYTNIAEVNTTIDCNDSRPGPSDATIRATARSWATRFPLFGLASAPALFSCQQWQPVRTVVPARSAPTPHPVLVLGNLHDPATPYQGSQHLATAMGNARVLSWDGEGHTSYTQGSSCVDGYVDRYLVTGALPAVGTTCPR